jgi:hypothetical protein
MGIEEFNAFSWRRRCPQQRAERAPMHHAKAGVLLRLKCQRVNIIAPDGCCAGRHQSIMGVAARQLVRTCCLAGMAAEDGSRFCD